MRSSSALSVLSTLTLLLNCSLTAATPLALEPNTLNSTIEKRCANPCGYNDWLCCSSGQTCSTNSANEAVCSDSGGSSGEYQYFTTIYTLTETDLSTITSVWSSQLAAATSTGTCRADIGETKCGTRCCEAAQECQDGECVAESSSVAITATGTDAAATPGVRGTSNGASTVTATSAPTTTEGFTAPVGTDGADLIGAKASDNSGGLSGGAIAGIVIGSIAGAFLLLMICASHSMDSLQLSVLANVADETRPMWRSATLTTLTAALLPPAGRRTWFGARPAAEGSDVSEKKSSSWGKLAILFGALAICLGLKRHHDKEHDDSKTESSYPSSYYYYSDYYSGTGSMFTSTPHSLFAAEVLTDVLGTHDDPDNRALDRAGDDSSLLTFIYDF
ncbi:hypothetical protein N7452_001196 [Penicillium brevicompactum]|uniref:GPI anchored protein n=1 Tax=Penicillium brevicompactum TaxID=5074 RepID=A0A9W9R1W9_PENBR|nr:hypothetical protein N7452_001196 [Penicillium brevicompactum]